MGTGVRLYLDIFGPAGCSGAAGHRRGLRVPHAGDIQQDHHGPAVMMMRTTFYGTLVPERDEADRLRRLAEHEAPVSVQDGGQA